MSTRNRRHRGRGIVLVFREPQREREYVERVRPALERDYGPLEVVEDRGGWNLKLKR